MNFSSPAAARANPHFAPGGEAGAAAAADLGRLHLLQQLPRESASRSTRRRPDQSPGRVSTGSSSSSSTSPAPRRRAHAPASTRATTPGPASTTSPSRTARRRCGRSRGRRSRRARPSRRRALAELQPERRAQLVDVRVAGRGEAGGPGADAHVARAARLQQVVVEGRDAVDGGLGQAGALGGLAAVLVGDLAALRRPPPSARRARSGRRARGGGGPARRGCATSPQPPIADIVRAGCTKPGSLTRCLSSLRQTASRTICSSSSSSAPARSGPRRSVSLSEKRQVRRRPSAVRRMRLQSPQNGS